MLGTVLPVMIGLVRGLALEFDGPDDMDAEGWAAGVGPLLKPALGLLLGLFGPGSADPTGTVVEVGVGLTILTDNESGWVPGPARLPRLPPSGGPAAKLFLRPSVIGERPAPLLRRDSISAFWRCLTPSMDLTCSIACESSFCIVNPITTGEMGVVGGAVMMPPGCCCC